jgi:ParB/RepB/Spo0J family partition protein
MTDTKEATRLRDLKTSARDQLMIDPRIIVVQDGHNPRDYSTAENRKHLDDLKESIRANGTLSPLWVRWDAATKSAVLVDGECRLRANLELIAEGVEIAAVPTIQVGATTEEDQLLLAIIANQNKPLSKLELGNSFQKLYRFGWSPETIATKTGCSVRFVSDSMELAEAPTAVREMVAQEEVTEARAITEVRKNGARAVEILKERVAAAKENGQGTVKRERAVSESRVINFGPVVGKLLKGVKEDDLNNEDFEWIEVNREVLLTLWRLLNPERKNMKAA